MWRIAIAIATAWVLISCSSDDDLPCDCRLFESRVTFSGGDTLPDKYLEDYYIDDCELDNKSIDKYTDFNGDRVRVFLKCN